jgi:DNA topoisomerase-2
LIRHRLNGTVDDLKNRPLDPWWFGFRGAVVRTSDNTWVTKGIYSFDDDKHSVTITELPVGTWTKDYKAFLDELCEKEDKKDKTNKSIIRSSGKGGDNSSKKSTNSVVETIGFKGFDDLYNDIDIKFVLYFSEDGYDNIKYNIEKFEKSFKLTSTWKTSNMCCFDSEFNIRKYDTIGDILEEFIQIRLPLYEDRRVSILNGLTVQITELSAKRKFLQAILDGHLELVRKTDEEIVRALKECDIPALSNISKPDECDSYEYVLKMRIDRVKASAIKELDDQVADKRAEIERLESETASSLWLSDLSEFEQEWDKYQNSRISEMTAEKGVNSNKKDKSVKLPKRKQK